MHIETIESVDFLGNPRKEEYCFFLNEAELTAMQLTTDGGMFSRLKRITQAQDNSAIIKEFEGIILNSYGEISPDGKLFIKEDPITGEKLCKRFKQSDAYNKLFMSLFTDPDKALEFFVDILPESYKNEIKSKTAEVDKLKSEILPSALTAKAE